MLPAGEAKRKGSVAGEGGRAGPQQRATHPLPVGQVALETSLVVTFVARLLPELLGRETPSPTQEGRHGMETTRGTYQPAGKASGLSWPFGFRH